MELKVKSCNLFDFWTWAVVAVVFRSTQTAENTKNVRGGSYSVTQIWHIQFNLIIHSSFNFQGCQTLIFCTEEFFSWIGLIAKAASLRPPAQPVNSSCKLGRCEERVREREGAAGSIELFSPVRWALITQAEQQQRGALCKTAGEPKQFIWATPRTLFGVS